MAEKIAGFKTLAEIMAEFAFGLTFDAIPPDVRAAARRHLADSFACALGAYHAETVSTVRHCAMQKDGGAEATILGTARKVNAGPAALVNGTMIRYLDANDIFIQRRGVASGHCSDATPALVALAEQQGSSGDELLTCLVASYELQGALAETFRFRDHGLHPLAQVAWAAPIVAARLFGATPRQSVHACGLAVATSTVLNTWLRPAEFIPAIKSVAVGMVLERVLEAAELASRGVTATEDALESAFACFTSVAPDPIDPTPITELGQRWYLRRNMIKNFPAQVYTQAVIEAALGLYQRNVRAERIAKLVLYGNRHTCAGVQGSPHAFAPASREAADHSTPFVLAMSLLHGRLTAREFHDAPWERGAVRSLMGKMELVDDPQWNLSLDAQGVLGVRLVAELRDGSKEEIIVPQAKGHPDAPLSDAELIGKMVSILEDTAPAYLAERLFDGCLRLSSVDDVRRLIATSDLSPYTTRTI